jgi:hypothetical protein
MMLIAYIQVLRKRMISQLVIQLKLILILLFKFLEESNKLFGHFYCEIIAPEDLNYPILQIHYKGENGIRIISPVGKFSGWFFSEELKNSLKFGYKIKVLRGYQFFRGNIFKGWIEEQYKLRTYYPKSHPLNYIGKFY